MKRDEAEKLVGQSVQVWLGADGEYVGRLLSVSDDAPWAVRIKVTGVVEPARHFDQGVLSRRGWREGEVCSTRGFPQFRLSPAASPHGTSYLAALQQQLSRQVSTHAGILGASCTWLQEAMANAARAVLMAEERRIRTGVWLLIPEEGAPAF